MRTREEVVKLMGAKDREVDSVVEVPAGTVVSIHGYRTLIHPDGSMTHGVEQPEVEKLSVEGRELVEDFEEFLGDEAQPVAKPAPVKKTTAKKG